MNKNLQYFTFLGYIIFFFIIYMIVSGVDPPPPRGSAPAWIQGRRQRHFVSSRLRSASRRVLDPDPDGDSAMIEHLSRVKYAAPTMSASVWSRARDDPGPTMQLAGFPRVGTLSKPRPRRQFGPNLDCWELSICELDWGLPTSVWHSSLFSPEISSNFTWGQI